MVFQSYGLIPEHLIESPVSAYPTIYSSMFLHSGVGHLAGNMLYLWIFGNNIEDVLGKLRFIIFYLICGTLASMGHIITDIQSNIPMVGASGAISGILGAYLVLFPFARVKTLIFLGFFNHYRPCAGNHSSGYLDADPSIQRSSRRGRQYSMVRSYRRVYRWHAPYSPFQRN